MDKFSSGHHIRLCRLYTAQLTKSKWYRYSYDTNFPADGSRVEEGWLFLICTTEPFGLGEMVGREKTAVPKGGESINDNHVSDLGNQRLLVNTQVHRIPSAGDTFCTE